MGDVRLKKASKKSEERMDFVSWFEIPATDFRQAVDFYQQIFGITMQESRTETNAMAFFPARNGVGGAVIAGPGSVPSDTGPLIYLNGGKDLNVVLDRVEKAGGRIIMHKTLISEESGYFAIFLDSQGNKLALYSTH